MPAPESIANVNVVLKANNYFDGKAVSRMLRFCGPAWLLAGILLTTFAAGLRADNGNPKSVAEKSRPPIMLKMDAELGVTADQAARLDELWKNKMNEIRAWTQNYNKLIATLSEQVARKASDSDIQATLDEVDAYTQEDMKIEARFRAQQNAIYTPTQRAKLLIKFTHLMPHGGPRIDR
jgi:Spy/CpxP family protein refolding chaperone